VRKIIADNIKEFKQMPFIEKLETIGGFLVLMYVPIFITMVWLPDHFSFLFNIFITNSILIVFLKLFIHAHKQ